jgi:transposase-like protein
MTSLSYRGHRFPAPIIQHAIWLYVRLRKLLKKQGFVPKLAVTDKLPSYAAAFRELRLTCRHEPQTDSPTVDRTGSTPETLS